MERVEEQAKMQLESIREMLAAVSVDYARLEELRDERKAAQAEVQDACEAYDEADEEQSIARRDAEDFDPDELGEACEALQDAEEALYQWGRDYDEELADLEEDAGDCESEDEALERIQEDPLSVEVRCPWQSPGEEDVKPSEFRILLCTGGPAVQIRGELNEYSEPTRAYMEYQDWGTPWTSYYEPGCGDTLLEYAGHFYFGE